ncbi:Zinc knuckle (CCHC-type) family protein [Thalictrum thalictroides]|uniref:Zinc knuckle (CCHC-type) family protein n=1 Tax=Thalictrum thalictroides TaxID=46969 RepID=A0A7J6W2R6_THATH|nr:Zinc knuckle (CCHC-type) family protein [Thalictrum thalictroides]
MVADEEVFYFKLKNEDDKIMAIEKGPFFIAYWLFVLRFWSPKIEKGKNLISSVPIWIKLEGVPKRLWSKDGLGFLASLIGWPVCLDEATKKKTKLKFARVCVEVDIDCSFPKTIKARIKEEIIEVKVEYSWIPNKCTKCASFGHLTNRCNKKVTHVWQKNEKTCTSCARDNNGVEINPKMQQEVRREVVNPSTETTHILKAVGNVARVETVTSNRFTCLQEDENNVDGQSSALVVYEEPIVVIEDLVKEGKIEKG